MPSFKHTKMRYTVKEACGILSVGTTRIYELFNEGLLKFMMDGRRRYVPAQALDEYMERIVRDNLGEQPSSGKLR